MCEGEGLTWRVRAGLRVVLRVGFGLEVESHLFLENEQYSPNCAHNRNPHNIVLLTTPIRIQTSTHYTNTNSSRTTKPALRSMTFDRCEHNCVGGKSPRKTKITQFNISPLAD